MPVRLYEVDKDQFAFVNLDAPNGWLSAMLVTKADLRQLFDDICIPLGIQKALPTKGVTEISLRRDYDQEADINDYRDDHRI